MVKDQMLSGRVVRGERLGRRIGFPTANIHASLPEGVEYGVYLVKIMFDESSYFGVANIGRRPTVNSLYEPIVEIHILDFDRQIYGKEIKIKLIEFIRKERKFSSVEELTGGIKEDVKKARQLLNKVI